MDFEYKVKINVIYLMCVKVNLVKLYIKMYFGFIYWCVYVMYFLRNLIGKGFKFLFFIEFNFNFFKRVEFFFNICCKFFWVCCFIVVNSRWKYVKLK